MEYMKIINNFINGKIVESDTNEYSDVYNLNRREDCKSYKL